MCVLSRLHCAICHSRERVFFRPCKTFKVEYMKSASREPIPPGTRFYCCELNFPFPADQGDFDHICEDCLDAGATFYTWQVQAKKEVAFSRSHYQNRVLSKPGPKIYQNGALTQVDDTNDVASCLPPGYYLLNERLRDDIVTQYFKNKKYTDNFWRARQLEHRHRYLTVWVPFCSICNHISTNKEGKVEAELEPNSVAWKWLMELSRLGEKGVETSIVTGSIGKPCQVCVDKETKIRDAVREALKSVSNPAAWAIWQWVSNRGIGRVPMWEPEVVNVGLPGSKPYSEKDFMRMMDNTWCAKSGIDWVDTIDLTPPFSCCLAMSLHQEPILNASEYKKWMERKSASSHKITAGPRRTISSLHLVALAGQHGNAHGLKINDRYLRPELCEAQGRAGCASPSAIGRTQMPVRIEVIKKFSEDGKAGQLKPTKTEQGKQGAPSQLLVRITGTAINDQNRAVRFNWHQGQLHPQDTVGPQHGARGTKASFQHEALQQNGFHHSSNGTIHDRTLKRCLPAELENNDRAKRPNTASCRHLNDPTELFGRCPTELESTNHFSDDDLFGDDLGSPSQPSRDTLAEEQTKPAGSVEDPFKSCDQRFWHIPSELYAPGCYFSLAFGTANEESG